MIGDRPYMRTPEGPARLSVTAYILIAASVCFVLQQLVDRAVVQEYFALSVEGVSRGFVWQLVTFQFLHGGFLHLLFNGIVIYFFGKHVEAELGEARYLQLYLLSGGIGGLFQLAVSAASGEMAVSTVGASAGAYGLVAALARLHYYERITVLLFFVIPMTFQARFLFYAGVGLSVFGMLTAPDGNIAHAAHLGGLLGGSALVRWAKGASYGKSLWRPQFRSSKRRASGGKVVTPDFAAKPSRASGVSPRSSTYKPTPDMSSEEFISKEIDPILDKISEQGIQSLTDRERKILDSAHNRMGRKY